MVALVYELYAPTPEEIRVVEEATDETGQANRHGFGVLATGGDHALANVLKRMIE